MSDSSECRFVFPYDAINPRSYLTDCVIDADWYLAVWVQLSALPLLVASVKGSDDRRFIMLAADETFIVADHVVQSRIAIGDCEYRASNPKVLVDFRRDRLGTEFAIAMDQ